MIPHKNQNRDSRSVSSTCSDLSFLRMPTAYPPHLIYKFTCLLERDLKFKISWGGKKLGLGRGRSWFEKHFHQKSALSTWKSTEASKSCFSISPRPVFGCGLPWEGSMNLHEETLQLRPFLRELIAKACTLASLQHLGKKILQLWKRIRAAHHSFHSVFCKGWRFLNGLGDGLEFPGNEELQSRVVKKLKNSREEKLVSIGSAR